MKPYLFVLGVGGLFLAIFIPVAWISQQQNGEKQDAYRMRQVFVALALYEGDHDQQSAPDLLAVRDRLSEDAMYLATGDRDYAAPFPLEPMLPSWEPRSPVRISFAYLGNFVRAGKIQIPNWEERRRDPKQGFLACPWYGSSGLIVRVNVDGSVYRLTGAQSAPMASVEDLFQRR